MSDHETTPVETALSAATLSRTQVTRLPLQRRSHGFTLAELLVTVGVVVLLVFLATQLLKSAATVTTLGHKRMDLDSASRQLLDRMATDFAQMVKRSDVDYYVKSSATAPLRRLLWQGNDKIAFYSNVPGYYPSSGSQSPVSLVSYRINAQHKLERVGKGLVWNAVSTADTPVVFIPIPIASPIPTPELPVPPPAPIPAPAWRNVDDLTQAPTPEPNAEVIGPQVFRFEYYYLVRGQYPPGTAAAPTPTPAAPILSDVPWDTRICACPPAPTSTPIPNPTPTGTPIIIATPTPPLLCCHISPNGMQDVAAVVVVIAVIDPKSKALLDTVDPTGAKLARLNGADGQPQGPALTDWGKTGVGFPTQAQWQTTPGLLMAQWRAALDANTVGLPLPAISGIRVYERYLYLSPPTLLTP